MKNGTKAIAIVDDELEIIRLIEMFLKATDKNVQTYTFTDAIEAYNFVHSHKIDVLITDYKMPGMDGITLIESANDIEKKILISGYVSEIAWDKLSRLDAVCFEKPVAMKKLARVVLDS
jgi:two-component system response regulator YesN